MKKIYLLLFAFIAMGSTQAQEEESIQLEDDTTKIKIGNMTIIFNDEDEDDFDFDMDDTLDTNSDEIGVVLQASLGMNGWMTGANSTTFESQYEDMSLQLTRSREFSLHFLFENLDVFNHHLFVSPGLGVTWNNYHFENKNVSISTGGDTTQFVRDTSLQFDKYKLRATYLEVPLTLGARIGNVDKGHMVIEAGVVAGINISSVVKQRYFVSEVKYKNKVRDDFNVNPFKLDVIAKIKINEGLGIYGRYSLTSMFENNKTQEVYPFSIGIVLGGL